MLNFDTIQHIIYKFLLFNYLFRRHPLMWLLLNFNKNSISFLMTIPCVCTHVTNTWLLGNDAGVEDPPLDLWSLESLSQTIACDWLQQKESYDLWGWHGMSECPLYNFSTILKFKYARNLYHKGRGAVNVTWFWRACLVEALSVSC